MLEKLSPVSSFENGKNLSIPLQFQRVCRFMSGEDTQVFSHSEFWYQLNKLQAQKWRLQHRDMHEQLRLEWGKFGKLKQS